MSPFWCPAVQQLEFLEGRKKQYLKAALQAKQKNDIEQAKALFRTAKSLDPIIEGARSGTAVDIGTVSALTLRRSPPEDEPPFQRIQTCCLVASGAVPPRRRGRGLHPGASQRRAGVGQSGAGLRAADEDSQRAVRGAPPPEEDPVDSVPSKRDSFLQESA